MENARLSLLRRVFLVLCLLLVFDLERGAWPGERETRLFAEAGIPGLHNWLGQAFPSAVRQVNKKKEVLLVDHLLFDLNQLLHQRAACGAQGGDSRKALEATFSDEADAVLRRLVSLISATLRSIHPRKSVVFALDGVPPLAKLLTTAKRRRKREDEVAGGAHSEAAEDEDSEGDDAGFRENDGRGETQGSVAGVESDSAGDEDAGDAGGAGDADANGLGNASKRRQEGRDTSRARGDGDEEGEDEGVEEGEEEGVAEGEDRIRFPPNHSVGATLDGLRLPEKTKKERYRIPSHLLTPGTAFMRRVEETCRRFAWQRLASRRYQHLNFFISGSTSFGEGELKLIDWLLAAKNAQPFASLPVSSSDPPSAPSPSHAKRARLAGAFQETDVLASPAASAEEECDKPAGREGRQDALSRRQDGGATEKERSEQDRREEERRERERREEESVVIVGADADLVVQALAFPGVPNLFVYNPQKRLSDEKNMRSRSHLIRNDIALLCILNGNDYLPKAGGFTFPRFFEAYAAVRRRPEFADASLVDAASRSFNFSFFLAFLDELETLSSLRLVALQQLQPHGLSGSLQPPVKLSALALLNQMAAQKQFLLPAHASSRSSPSAQSKPLSPAPCQDAKGETNCRPHPTREGTAGEAGATENRTGDVSSGKSQDDENLGIRWEIRSAGVGTSSFTAVLHVHPALLRPPSSVSSPLAPSPSPLELGRARDTVARAAAGASTTPSRLRRRVTSAEKEEREKEENEREGEKEREEENETSEAARSEPASPHRRTPRGREAEDAGGEARAVSTRSAEDEKDETWVAFVGRARDKQGAKQDAAFRFLLACFPDLDCVAAPAQPPGDREDAGGEEDEEDREDEDEDMTKQLKAALLPNFHACVPALLQAACTLQRTTPANTLNNLCLRVFKAPPTFVSFTKRELQEGLFGEGSSSPAFASDTNSPPLVSLSALREVLIQQNLLSGKAVEYPSSPLSSSPSLSSSSPSLSSSSPSLSSSSPSLSSSSPSLSSSSPSLSSLTSPLPVAHGEGSKPAVPAPRVESSAELREDEQGAAGAVLHAVVVDGLPLFATWHVTAEDQESNAPVKAASKKQRRHSLAMQALQALAPPLYHSLSRAGWSVTGTLADPSPAAEGPNAEERLCEACGETQADPESGSDARGDARGAEDRRIHGSARASAVQQSGARSSEGDRRGVAAQVGTRAETAPGETKRDGEQAASQSERDTELGASAGGTGCEGEVGECEAKEAVGGKEDENARETSGKQELKDVDTLLAEHVESEAPKVAAYLQGLLWNLRMYTEGQCPNSRWFYPFGKAPSLYALRAHLRAHLSSRAAGASDSTPGDSPKETLSARHLKDRSDALGDGPFRTPDPVLNSREGMASLKLLDCLEVPQSAAFPTCSPLYAAAVLPPGALRRLRGSLAAEQDAGRADAEDDGEDARADAPPRDRTTTREGDDVVTAGLGRSFGKLVCQARALLRHVMATEASSGAESAANGVALGENPPIATRGKRTDESEGRAGERPELDERGFQGKAPPALEGFSGLEEERGDSACDDDLRPHPRHVLAATVHLEALALQRAQGRARGRESSETGASAEATSLRLDANKLSAAATQEGARADGCIPRLEGEERHGDNKQLRARAACGTGEGRRIDREDEHRREKITDAGDRDLSVSPSIAERLLQETTSSWSVLCRNRASNGAGAFPSGSPEKRRPNSVAAKKQLRSRPDASSSQSSSSSFSPPLSPSSGSLRSSSHSSSSTSSSSFSFSTSGASFLASSAPPEMFLEESLPLFADPTTREAPCWAKPSSSSLTWFPSSVEEGRASDAPVSPSVSASKAVSSSALSCATPRLAIPQVPWNGDPRSRSAFFVALSLASPPVSSVSVCAATSSTFQSSTSLFSTSLRSGRIPAERRSEGTSPPFHGLSPPSRRCLRACRFGDELPSRSPAIGCAHSPERVSAGRRLLSPAASGASLSGTAAAGRVSFSGRSRSSLPLLGRPASESRRLFEFAVFPRRRPALHTQIPHGESGSNVSRFSASTSLRLSNPAICLERRHPACPSSFAGGRSRASSLPFSPGLPPGLFSPPPSRRSSPWSSASAASSLRNSASAAAAAAGVASPLNVKSAAP
ncbi:conserved hypothetical protein [Neospora caninum Liverpool]|uniref:Xrn1 N-terminal domain-containing protein n=1 Tax=Neospora caninum (strain Liverpool) TaxID=572307 RepID=F0VA25_NEOCL|nr:conserved hypothetical protein [Neospora caninum Liverpool]CBZ50514.1 conserved hypothetical protein [Neospora caninum Liverpool]|eukprot:XP_003880547.1 conserved hypothetical protein [Neospora caninum Liverpool]